MSNLDVAGLEVCRRLAKAGWAITTFFRYDKKIEELGEWVLCQAAGRWRPAYAVDAPTIGEMLDYIRRRGWGYHSLWSEEDGGGYAAWVEVDEPRKRCTTCGHELGPSGHYYGDGESLADALANALSEALEKEKP